MMGETKHEKDTDEEELKDMEQALESGQGFDSGANLSDGMICGPCDDSGPLAQKPMLLRGPCDPTQQQMDLYNLTHLPYMSWCPHCVATRRPNIVHVSSKQESTIPQLATDYCYVRDSVDQDTVTCLVARVFPWKMTFAVTVDVKGRDEAAIKRLSSFIKSCGLTHFSYRSDQEASLLALVEEAILMAGKAELAEKTGEAVVGAPELSSVGESQSNGKSERGVQLVEDLIRTLKSAFEARLGMRLGSTHPIMCWLVEYASVLLSKYSVGNDGFTAYQKLHGKRAHEKLVEFGEKVLYFIPKAKRAKLDKRFGLGVYLGRALWGDENYIARADGTVVRARGLARLSPKLRWDAKWFKGIHGTPNDMMANPDNVDIESRADPHAEIQSEQEKKAMEDQGTEERTPMSMRLTKQLCEQYGYTDKCLRCRFYKNGKLSLKQTNHSAECRQRLYQAMRDAGDVRLREDKTSSVEKAATASDPLPEPGTLSDDKQKDMDDDIAFDRAFNDLDGPALDDGGIEIDATGGDELDEGMNIDTLTDLLMTCGVETVNASRAAIQIQRLSKASQQSGEQPTFVEAYGRGSLNEQAHSHRRNLNIQGLGALDLRTRRPDGKLWDLSKPSHQKLVMQLVKIHEPTWIIGAPPCTSFSTLNTGLNFPRMNPEDVERIKAEGKAHLRFACRLYRYQVKHGRHFLHEHPAGASSWHEDCIQDLMCKPEVGVTVGDQCQYGLVTPCAHNRKLTVPAKKHTKFMSTSEYMLKRLSKLCKGEHDHQPLIGGRASQAAFYPLPLVMEILRGIRDTADREAKEETNDENSVLLQPLSTGLAPRMGELSMVALASKEEIDATNAKARSWIPVKDDVANGLDVSFAESSFKTRYLDEYTREELPLHLVKAAMIDELSYFNDHVWQVSTMSQARADPDSKLVRTRWVLCNKGDEEEPDIRARLVACELNQGEETHGQFYAATPPLECKRMLFSGMTTRRTGRTGGTLKLSFVDVRKAYFNGIPKRKVYFTFPVEMGLDKSSVGFLVRCACGTRDAGAIWEETWLTGVD